MMSAGWAAPLAVLSTHGSRSPWLILAYPVGAASGLYWAWYVRWIEQWLARNLFPRTDWEAHRLPPNWGLGSISVSVLALTLLAQYGLYRLLRLVLTLYAGR